MHIYNYVLHNYKVSGNSVERFQRSFSSIFHFGQISKYKKGVIPRKKIESKFPVDMHAHLHIMSCITTKFQEILWRGFRGVALTGKTGLTD